jgi:hypothetical protein
MTPGDNQLAGRCEQAIEARKQGGVSVTIRHGDCREVLRTLPDESVHCCVTSPPYFGLRDYGVAGQIGLEPTPDAFVAEMIAVFREVRRVLRAMARCGLTWGTATPRRKLSGCHPDRQAIKGSPKALRCMKVATEARCLL